MLANIQTEPVRKDFNLLLSVVSQDVKLLPAKGYYFGPCPFCGAGEDRFKLFDNEGKSALFNCRVCGHKGDVHQYIQDRRGWDFVTAARWLQTAEIKPAPAPVAIEPAANSELDLEQRQEWQNRLLAMTGRAADHLRYTESTAAEAARRWLAARGIGLVEIERFVIGFNDHWRQILPGYKLPPGVTIPWYDENLNLQAVQVYLDRPSRHLIGNKRIFVRGSQPSKTLFNAPALLSGPDSIFITEGELDCVLLSHFLLPYQTTTAAVTAGGVSMFPKAPKGFTAAKIYLLLDNDPAGQAAVAKWKEALPRATVLKVPQGKDITEFFQAGGDVAAWLERIMHS